MGFKLPEKLISYFHTSAMHLRIISDSLLLSLNSAGGENTSPKITGHMTGMWVSFLKRIRLVQKH